MKAVNLIIWMIEASFNICCIISLFICLLIDIMLIILRMIKSIKGNV
jgi:hypothetical protein